MTEAAMEHSSNGKVVMLEWTRMHSSIMNSPTSVSLHNAVSLHLLYWYALCVTSLPFSNGNADFGCRCSYPQKSTARVCVLKDVCVCIAWPAMLLLYKQLPLAMFSIGVIPLFAYSQ